MTSLGGLAGAFRGSEETLPHPDAEGQTGLGSGDGEERVLVGGEAGDGGAVSGVVGFGSAGSRGHAARLAHTESLGNLLTGETLAHTISPMTSIEEASRTESTKTCPVARFGRSHTWLTGAFYYPLGAVDANLYRGYDYVMCAACGQIEKES